MQVVADVDEADIGEVKEGARVTFTVDAYPNDTFEGEVTQVRQEATTTNNVVTYEVVISAPNTDLDNRHAPHELPRAQITKKLECFENKEQALLAQKLFQQ